MTAERQFFQARTGALTEVIGFVERRGADLGLAHPTTLKLLLVAEELFINTVLHGYGGDCDQEVVLAIRDLGAEVELLMEDRAAEFDPFAHLPAVPTSGDPNRRPVGGLGRILVAGVASRHGYQRHEGLNRVCVCVPKRSTIPDL